ncbi:MAG: hypothetical protein CO135_02600 [Candidatus Levybacteria bacterium CG_4_9_14_3_um_filter_35_16]|nr:MAG: hypothetical protein COW87_02365 [Candidatus Levybacteria bacterium CG22_combo_CG10-13_8_21_14_all_35_11]PIY94405.1 MAG: hypothetical protein COY68_02490 [Candidatus Levybacteria bacterium CG_4_10_14_0_8_um_filter_35_23]PJA00529.1 MAG: hypothetical protein COX78_00405 [Candidatus Levybacteria bacterium CG_4_10_14_0_2_um_filter_35_8]PJA91152.1 MAG: hypothetical protein CO135_02600 [Candidatus Levybacteria bacterium CG_4_9_14_3_um_filter_35_16]PJC54030.1 MAG: hypothetical protein CO028_04
MLDAQTGNNDTNFNTDSNSTIKTGNAEVDANVLNIANSNIDGGNWWLVIVNRAGQWFGQIIGSPDGSTFAGSAGTEFAVDPVTGEVTAINNANGANSSNSSNANQTTNNTVVQSNTANVNNALNLSANTGNNTSNFNTGGNSGIVTGDAKIIANIVNFVNNNIASNGKLVVTVINVFGSWLGDFIAPGQTKQQKTENNNQQTQTAAVQNQDNNLNNGNSGGSNNNSNSDNGQSGAVAASVTSNALVNNGGSFTSVLVAGVSDQAKNILAKNVLGKTDTKAIKINAAWLIVLIPGIVLLLVLGKKIKNLPRFLK